VRSAPEVSLPQGISTGNFVILAQFDASWRRFGQRFQRRICQFAARSGQEESFDLARNLSIGGREETTARGSRYHDTPT
jgi:hypothetical protein